MSKPTKKRALFHLTKKKNNLPQHRKASTYFFLFSGRKRDSHNETNWSSARVGTDGRLRKQKISVSIYCAVVWRELFEKGEFRRGSLKPYKRNCTVPLYSSLIIETNTLEIRNIRLTIRKATSWKWTKHEDKWVWNI